MCDEEEEVGIDVGSVGNPSHRVVLGAKEDPAAPTVGLRLTDFERVCECRPEKEDAAGAGCCDGIEGKLSCGDDDSLLGPGFIVSFCAGTFDSSEMESARREGDEKRISVQLSEQHFFFLPPS